MVSHVVVEPGCGDSQSEYGIGRAPVPMLVPNIGLRLELFIITSHNAYWSLLVDSRYISHVHTTIPMPRSAIQRSQAADPAFTRLDQSPAGISLAESGTSKTPLPISSCQRSLGSTRPDLGNSGFINSVPLYSVAQGRTRETD